MIILWNIGKLWKEFLVNCYQQFINDIMKNSNIAKGRIQYTHITKRNIWQNSWCSPQGKEEKQKDVHKRFSRYVTGHVWKEIKIDGQAVVVTFPTL